MRIEKLEIDDLRSIKRLRWPEDGIGWGGRIPDVVVVAGANGSGKTTLLNEIFEHLNNIYSHKKQIESYKDEDQKLTRYTQIALNKAKIKFTTSNQKHTFNQDSTLNEALQTIYEDKGKLIYFKSKRSNAELSSKSSKSVQNLPDTGNTHYVWDQNRSNDISIEQICYSARWEDANAILNGRPEKATKFKFYADEFERFTEGDKKLVWSDEGELLVETRDGVRHDPNELSSGEHQALIFAMMLSRRWAPGSIVLIDEPELHLHTHWQAKLLQRIIDLQRERGGQAILATQSSELFAMAPRGSQVLLGGW